MYLKVKGNVSRIKKTCVHTSIILFYKKKSQLQKKNTCFQNPKKKNKINKSDSGISQTATVSL